MNGDLVFEGPRFYSRGDEDHFFERMYQLACVKRVVGRGLNLHLDIDWTADEESLSDLLILLFRFGIDMPNAVGQYLANGQNWLDRPDCYWSDWLPSGA